MDPKKRSFTLMAQVSSSCSPLTSSFFRSALQILHKACEVSRRYNYFPGGMALTWTGYYESCIGSEQSCINEWNAMQDLETLRPDSPAVFFDKWVQTLRVLRDTGTCETYKQI